MRLDSGIRDKLHRMPLFIVNPDDRENLAFIRPYG
jgi:hypothetical protein